MLSLELQVSELKVNMDNLRFTKRDLDVDPRPQGRRRRDHRQGAHLNELRNKKVIASFQISAEHTKLEPSLRFLEIKEDHTHLNGDAEADDAKAA